MLDCGSLQAAKLPALKVKGTQLVNAKGKPVQLKGASTHGLSWFPEYVNQKSFSHLKKNWKANAVRLALYTSEYNGYCTGDAANRRALEKRVADGVKYATKAGLYVIIDWHILSDGNPKTYQRQAASFFKKMAGKYGGFVPGRKWDQSLCIREPSSNSGTVLCSAQAGLHCRHQHYRKP